MIKSVKGINIYIIYKQKMIVRNIITEEQEIKKILKTLCENNPLMSSKQNISGYGSNDRVIVVRGQFFQFYNLPSKFKNGDMSTLNQSNFKARVSLTDIYQITFLPQGKNEKKSMVLSIPLNKLTAKNIQLYKSSASKVAKQKEPAQNFIVNWLFTFSFDVKQYIFKKLEEEQKQRKEKQSKIVRYDPQSSFGESILNISSIKNYDPDFDAVKDLNYNVEKLKEVKQFIQFKQKLQKQEEQRQNAIKKSMLLRKNERGELNQQNQQDQTQTIYPIRFEWREFWKIYQKVNHLNGASLSKDSLEKQLNLLSQLSKLQIQIKNIAMEYINFKLVGWGPDKIMFDDFQFYKGVWIKLGGKQLNQQFLSNYYLSDLMYAMKSVKKMKFRIPPMFFINYKCCKAICMIDLPFSSVKKIQKEVYNVKAQKLLDAELINKIKQGLEVFQRILNIKNQSYINGNIQTTAPLGCDVKVFQYDNKYEEGTSNFLQQFYYVTGVKGLFPPDYQFQLEKYQPQYCLRPELIAQYRDYMESIFREDNQLLTQAFKYSEISLDIKGKQDVKAAHVSKEFIPLKIKKLMQQFNQINLIMVDSYSIKQYMSQMGINVRYLGQMYKETEIPYIQQTLKVEMLSRVVKKFYCDSVRDLITNQSFFKRQLYLKKHKDVLLQNMKHHHDLMSNNAIDFLNLIFGVGRETQAFWKMVIDKCASKYGLEIQYPLKVKAGCLLHAVIWHCGFVVNFELDIRLFETQKPFDIKNWVDFRFQCKSFDYPSFEVNKIIKKLSLLEQFKKEDQLEKYVFSFLKLELLRNHTSFGSGLKTQMTLSKINNKGSNYQKPLRDCNYHPSELPFYFSNKSNENFKKAIDIINFSLASNHPLFISLYDVYSSEFQRQLLKKSTLLAAIKGLGEFHPRTTELYSKFYHDGFQQFQIKAKRSQDLQAALIISNQLLSKKKYESCLNFCYSRVQMYQQRKSSSKSNDLQSYIKILKHGLISAVQTRFFQKGLYIAEEFSEIINTYKIRNLEDHQILMYHALIIRLNLASQKFYLYKMVLLVVKIQKQFEHDLKMDQMGLLLPRQEVEKTNILLAIMNQYYTEQTHSKWIQNIFVCLRRGYMYFNYLNDLFNNYKKHIKNYGMADFQVALGFLDVLVRFFGQKLFYDYLYQVSN